MMTMNRLYLTFAAIALCFSLSAPQALAASPFDKLAGTWRGTGQVRLEDGRSERLACRGQYAPRGSGQQLALRIACQSANVQIDMVSGLNYRNGRVDGAWQERVYSASGGISGSATESRLSLKISGQVSGTMLVAVTGRGHQVAIRTSGPALAGINISFSRG